MRAGAEADGRGEWRMIWRRSFFVWKSKLLHECRGLLEGVVLTREEDYWHWKPEDGGSFTVRLAYNILEGVLDFVEGLPDNEDMVFGRLWKSSVPSSVVAFSWKLLLDRIPTKRNLLIQNVANPAISTDCVWCEGVLETSSHLFLHCGMALKKQFPRCLEYDFGVAWLSFYYATESFCSCRVLAWISEY